MVNVNNLLRTMESYALENGIPIIRDEGANLLAQTVQKYQPKYVLEIGTAIGYSAIVIGANALDAKIVTIEIDKDRACKAKYFLAQAGLLDRVEIIEGDASQVINDLNLKFDMIFIDAAKGQYLNYLHKTIDKLTGNAVVFADNVLFRGMVEGDIATPRRYRTIVKRLRQYLDFMKTDSRFCTTLYRIGDGVAISIYRGAKNT